MFGGWVICHCDDIFVVLILLSWFDDVGNPTCVDRWVNGRVHECHDGDYLIYCVFDRWIKDGVSDMGHMGGAVLCM